MRFLILTQYFPPEVGAAQARLSAFATELMAGGHTVDVVTALPNYPSGRLDPSDRFRAFRREVIDGIRVTRMWLYPAMGAGFARLGSYLSFTATGAVGALSARGRPDVVFVESPPLFLGVAGWAAARRFGCLLVLNISDLWPDSIRDLGLMEEGVVLRAADRLEAWLYQQADAVTAVTNGIRQQLISGKGVPEHRVLFLPNGVDLKALGWSAAPPAGGVRPRLVFAGNHGYAQGLDVIIGAARLAPEIDFELIGGGSDKPRLQRKAADLNLVNVRFSPPQSQSGVAASYASAIAGIASLRDSELMLGARPAKLLAIMAAGRPVLYSGAGEGADLVRQADAGIVVPPQNPQALADAARKFIADPSRATVLGANGRRYVANHLSWPTLVDSWLEQLRAIHSPEPSR